MSFEKVDAKWAEELPLACPPLGTASPPKGEHYYRLTDQSPPVDKDFWSNRRLFPTAIYRVDECHARALSVFRCPIECEKMSKLPLQLSKRFIVELILDGDSGMVERTGKRKEHYSWWLKAEFDPLKIAKEHKALPPKETI